MSLISKYTDPLNGVRYKFAKPLWNTITLQKKFYNINQNLKYLSVKHLVLSYDNNGIKVETLEFQKNKASLKLLLNFMKFNTRLQCLKIHQFNGWKWFKLIFTDEIIIIFIGHIL